MKPNLLLAYIFTACLIFITVWRASLMTEEDTGQNALFSNSKRPVAVFNHALHEDCSGEETGCDRCHHIFDNKKNTLVYAEGEEAACSECHFSKRSKNIPALKEANHASCTACHRNLKKTGKPAGPSTCGECHKKIIFRKNII